MRWLMLGLLVSLGALLFAAAGVAYHIWRQRAKLRHEPAASTGKSGGPVQEADPENEP